MRSIWLCQVCHGLQVLMRVRLPISAFIFFDLPFFLLSWNFWSQWDSSFEFLKYLIDVFGTKNIKLWFNAVGRYYNLTKTKSEKMMAMPIILGWPVSILGRSSSREKRWRRLTQFSSTRVFLIQARNDWQQQFHLVLMITQPERKVLALLFPLHDVDSWSFSEVACRGRPWEVWQNSLRKWWLQKEQEHIYFILGLVPDNSWSIWWMVVAVEEWLEFSQTHFWA